MLRPTQRLLAQHARTPLIKFLGKRSTPQKVDHTPQPHPASEKPSLPDSFAESFAEYRSRATQHGPLKSQQSQPQSSQSSQGPTAAGASRMSQGSNVGGGSQTYGAVGGRSGKSLGRVAAEKGEFFDRSELPRRFRRMEWTEGEIEAVDSAGASLWN